MENAIKKFSSISVRGRSLYSLLCLETLLLKAGIEKELTFFHVRDFIVCFLTEKNYSKVDWFGKLVSMEPKYLDFVFDDLQNDEFIFEDSTLQEKRTSNEVEFSKWGSETKYYIDFTYETAFAFHKYFDSLPKDILQCYESVICLVTYQNEEQIVGESEMTLNYLFEIFEILSKFHIEFPDYKPFEQFRFSENNGWGKFIDDELIRKLLLD